VDGVQASIMGLALAIQSPEETIRTTCGLFVPE
jgi:hypothetical protein